MDSSTRGWTWRGALVALLATLGTGCVGPSLWSEELVATYVTPARSSVDPLLPQSWVAQGGDWEGRLLVLYGSLDGSMEVSSGGAPGTSTAGRPGLGELGIDEGLMVDLSVARRTSWGRAYLAQRISSQSERDTLAQAVTADGLTFAAGTPVRSGLDLNWTRVGHEWRYEVARTQTDSFGLLPSVEALLFNMEFELEDGTNGAAARRTVIEPNLRGGLGVDWTGQRTWRAWAGGFASLPLDDQPEITTLEAGIDYRLPQTERLLVDLGLAVVFDSIELDSDAERIDVEYGPALSVMLRVKF